MSITPKKYQSFRGRIKVGTVCGQDFSSFIWPHGLGRKLHDPDTVFNIEPASPTSCKCTADGFGVLGTSASYGNGAIYISGTPLKK